MRYLRQFIPTLCLAVLAASALDAQVPVQPSDVDSQTARAEELWKKGSYAEARDAGARALALYEAANNQDGIGRAAHLVGLAADSAGDRKLAAGFFRRAISAFQLVGNRRGRALATLGLLQTEVESRDEEVRLLQRTVDDATAAGDSTVVGRALHSWGDSLFVAGEYEQAIEKLDAARAAFESGGDGVALGTVHNSIGRLYRAHGRSDLALAEQLKALSLHEKAGSQYFQLQSLNAVAVTYTSLGDTARSRQYFERALTLAEKSESVRMQDFIRANFAGVLLREGEYAVAAAQLERILANGIDAYPSLRYRELSSAYLSLERSEAALNAAQQAVERCQRPHGIDCIYALEQRAKVFSLLGNSAGAAADRRAAVDSLEQVRARLIPRDFLRQQFTATQRALYSDTIAQQVQQRDIRGAIETAELARARAFLDLLAGSEVPRRDEQAALPLVFRGGAAPGTDPPAVSPPLDLMTSPTTRPLDVDGLAATARRLKSSLLMYWVADDALFIWVVKPDGAIHSARVAIIQAKLRDLIRSTSAVAEESGQAAAIRPVVARGQSPIVVSVVQSRAWRDLYDVLIRPVHDTLPARGSLLTIVPDGALTGLSFAALQNERGRYLLEDYALHYVPAASVLQFTAAKRRADARRSTVALIADPALKARSRLDRSLPPLPGARAEVRAIANLLSSNRTTTVEGPHATEGRIRELISESAVVHFATHAIVTDAAPFASFLALGATSGEPAPDGTLTATEIYGLKMHADLVVLSACRSGGGAITGDGIATFARAFMAAGTASLVTSLWDVADEPTNRLLPAFYRAWLRGTSKADALRAAQLGLLADLRAGKVSVATPVGEVRLPDHPAFWAGFALTGEP